jgi:hypothetical protein
VKQAEFKSLLFVDVADRAASERAPAPGGSTYEGRPWSRLRDEMLAGGAESVGELRSSEVVVFYHLTQSASGGVLSAFRNLFEGSSH